MPAIPLPDYFHTEFDDHDAVSQASRGALLEPFSRLVHACQAAIGGGGKILLFGNGGSAADAQHIAAELTIRYETYREPMAAVALTTDTSALTATGNDYSFDEIFARQVAALGKPGDVALGISTSGKSPNVLRGLETAKEMGLTAAALAGRDGGDLVAIADPILIVPSHTTSRIQEIHITLGHILCGMLERGLR